MAAVLLTERSQCVECMGLLVEDECNAESMLVCESCGLSQPVNPFTADDGTTGSMLSNASSNIPVETKHTARQKRRYGAKLEPSDVKLMKLKVDINQLAGQLKLSKFQVKIAEARAQVVSQLGTFNCSYSNKALAAGLIYVYCCEHTQHYLKRIHDILPHTTTVKMFNSMVRKLKHSPCEQSQIAPPTTAPPTLDFYSDHEEGRGLVSESELDKEEVTELMRDAVSKIDNSIIKKEERNELVTLANNLWDLLQFSNISTRLIPSHQPIVFAVITVSLNHLRRVNLKESDFAAICSHIHLTKRAFQNQILVITRALVSLGKMVPSLEPVIKKTPSCKQPSIMARHLTTLLQNKPFIVAETKLRSAVAQTTHSLPTGDSAVLMSTCFPRSYDQDDDEDTLSDVDVDQYIATENEIKMKTLLHS